MLDRLMRRPVLADADRIVAEHEDRRQLHDRGEPDRRAHIVAEDEEGRGERPQVRQSHAVGDRAHRMLANAEMHVPAALRLRFEIARALEGQPGLGRWREIRRAADQSGHVVRDRVQHLAAGIARGHSRGIRREVRNVAGPAVGQPAFEQTIELLGELGMFGAIADQSLVPGLAKRPRTIGEVGVGNDLIDSGRHEELRILGPAISALRLPDRFRAHRIAMRLGGAGDRRAPADDAVDDDQGRRVLGLAGTSRAPARRHPDRSRPRRAGRSSHSRETVRPRFR